MHQPDPGGFFCVDDASAHHQLQRTRKADGALKEVGPAITWNEPDANKRRAKPGGLRSDSDVAHAGQIETCADGRAVDCGNEGLVEGSNAARNTVDSLLIAGANGNGIAGEHARVFLHHLEVAACGERGAGTGNGNGLHRIIHQGSTQRIHQPLHHLHAVGIAGLGAVEANPQQTGQVGIGLGDHMLSHLLSP